LERALVARGIAHNRALLGAYGFSGEYRRLMQAWLGRAPREGGLVFCHPCAAAPRDGNPDPIGAARRREAAYFASDAFREDLAAAGVTLGAAWARRSSSAG
jgi:hypothetical protein